MTEECDKIYGCDHYKRKCMLIAPCCGKDYICRVCHDDKENHELNRREVQKIKCLICGTAQAVAKNCSNCGVQFGNYFCEPCRLFDDTEKGQFHCEPCGLCRVGGRDKFFHCAKCDMCLAVAMKDTHKCIEMMSRSNCPVCLNDLHTSRQSSAVPPCGHLIHQECMNQCLRTGNYKCPTCGESMVEMKDAWQQLDEEIAQVRMPEEYRNFKVQILCKDCHLESRVLFHVIGLKCQHCGSYNTCRAAEPENPPEEDNTAANGSEADMEDSTVATGSETNVEDSTTASGSNANLDQRQPSGPWREMEDF